MLGKPYRLGHRPDAPERDGRHYRSFQKEVLPVLNQRGIGSIGMKSLGGNGAIVTKAGVSVEEALRYVFSLPISTLVSGIDSEKVLDQNLKIVREFKPMTRRRTPRPRGQIRQAGRRRPVRAVQVDRRVRGPVHRKQHGFEVA